MKPNARSLRVGLLAHDNDYGFDARLSGGIEAFPSVACVMPYHDTGEIGRTASKRWLESMDAYRNMSDGLSLPNCKLIVVDDGSKRDPFVLPDHDSATTIDVIRLPTALGRSRARNIGLRHAADFEIVIFSDSDIYISAHHVPRILQLIQKVRIGIVASLFSTVPEPTEPDIDEFLANSSAADDWRWDCVYEPSWIGCAADYEFVSQRFRLVQETDLFRSWRGMIGPWSLANMVLGGCFATKTADALRVGGFDESFDQYGFTETTLVARLIASGAFVIPMVDPVALHISDQPDHNSQEERNRLFRIAHRRFFAEFLDGEFNA